MPSVIVLNPKGKYFKVKAVFIPWTKQEIGQLVKFVPFVSFSLCPKQSSICFGV